MATRSMKFFLPGIFALVLGLGNVGVGYFKGEQYKKVEEELTDIRPTKGLINASPLQRIQVTQNAADRLYQRQRQAQGRRDFYRLVMFGGKIISAFALILLSIAGGLRLRERGKAL